MCVRVAFEYFFDAVLARLLGATQSRHKGMLEEDGMCTTVKNVANSQNRSIRNDLLLYKKDGISFSHHLIIF
jgi:hypothetical protein